jgi:hypothetical protein
MRLLARGVRQPVLEPIPAARLPHEWETIGATLGPAIHLDPKRTWFDALGQGLRGELQFWRVGGSLSGFLVTQVCRVPDTLRRALWVIYVAGHGGSIADKRALMETIEHQARTSRCNTVAFEGRDWRRVFPDYAAYQTADGRWHFRKAV